MRKWFTISHMGNENNVICSVSEVFYIHMDNIFLEFLSPRNQQECREFLKIHSISYQTASNLSNTIIFIFTEAWLFVSVCTNHHQATVTKTSKIQ
jgi:hypothetical protein